MHDLVKLYFKINSTLFDNINLIVITKLDFVESIIFKLSKLIIFPGHMILAPSIQIPNLVINNFKIIVDQEDITSIILLTIVGFLLLLLEGILLYMTILST